MGSTPWKEAWEQMMVEAKGGCVGCQHGREIPGTTFTRTVICHHPLYPHYSAFILHGDKPDCCPKVI